MRKTRPVFILLFCVGFVMILTYSFDKILFPPLRKPEPVSQDPLYPSNLRLLNLPRFHYLINNKACANTENVYAIMIVTSYAADVETRSTIRQSLPSNVLKQLGVRRVFLLAVNDRQSRSDVNYVSQTALVHENARYGDLVQGDFQEAYRNLTYKHVMGLQWVVHYCKQARYIIKMDDDIVVDMFQLLHLLKGLFVEGYEEKDFMLGYVLRGMKPVREPKNKWFVTKEEYPESSYDPFLSGWLYVTTPITAEKLVGLSLKVPYFWIDDVYVTGILARMANIHHRAVNTLFTPHSEHLECCLDKAYGSENYQCDFMVGPSGNNLRLMKKFFTHAEMCYHKQCGRRSLKNSIKKMCIVQRKSWWAPMVKGKGEAKSIKLF